MVIIKNFYYKKFLCAAHKSVRAIWTHVQEAIWKDISMIVMSFRIDQKFNA